MRQALVSQTFIPEGEGRGILPPPAPEETTDRFPQFEILECLGRGGMGVVYKARQKSLNRLVAIKILASERSKETRFAERFAREAEILAQLNHPHIVTIHDFGEVDSLFFLVMEFVDGVNLRDLISDGKLEPSRALAIVSPICEALQYAHEKGVVHRDIKPENLLLDKEGRLKIADFGIASLIGAAAENAGTPPYMAPEQASEVDVDHRADIYALGVVFYEMLTGERPKDPLAVPSQKVQLDVRIDEIVLRALNTDPEGRYQTVGDFHTMVETVVETEQENVASVPPPSLPAVSPSKKKGGMLIGCLIAFLVAILLLVPVMIVILMIVFYNKNTAKEQSLLDAQIEYRDQISATEHSSVESYTEWIEVSFTANDFDGSDGRIDVPLGSAHEGEWFPLMGQPIITDEGETIYVQVRADSRTVEVNAVVTVRWSDETHAEGEVLSVKVGPKSRATPLDFENGLQASVTWHRLYDQH